MHRRNSVERAMKTWKNNFIEGICGVGKMFPIHLWYRLLKKSQTIVNLLRPDISNPNLLVKKSLEGDFGFNRTSLAPPVTKVIIHEKTGKQKLWDPHGVEGWYLVPTMEHYRFHILYVNKTRSEHIADTVEFPPEHNKIPGLSNQEAETNAVLDLIEFITNQSPTAPFASIWDRKLQAIRKFSDIFKQTTAP